MRAIAILATRNEELFIEICLKNLIAQGFEVYLMDNASTDRTVELAKKFLGKGLIEIENIPFNDEYRWYEILSRKEELAQELDADWFMHCDADEIHLPPSNFKTIITALSEVEKQGYNAINFDEFVFLPTSEAESFEGKDYVKEMQYYYFFEPMPLRRVKLWKKQKSRVNLAESGGHVINFPNKKIYPENFILKHYILLSKEHAERKYGKRVYNEKEVKEKGWHGSRAKYNQSRLNFPKRPQLKKTDKSMDKSEPWKEHKFIIEKQNFWDRLKQLILPEKN